MSELPKNVFVDAYLLNKEFQGTKTYIQELYQEFSKRNSEIQIYLGCFKSGDIEKEYSKYENIHLLFYKSNNRLKRMLFEIPKLIKKHQFQFAHFQYIIPLRRSSTTKYIVTIHDILFNDFQNQFSWFYRFTRNLLFKYSAKKSDYLCTVSSYSKDRIQSVYEIKKEIFITPNGVRSEYFEDYDREEEVAYVLKKYNIQNYLLYVSRIEPRKNHQAIIQLFSKLNNSEISLVFIGEKTMTTPELITRVNQLEDSEKQRVHFFNGLSSRNLLSFIRASRAFVYPSQAEGFGIPPLEAGACKIPVVCSNTTAMKDFYFFEPYLLDFNDENNTLQVLQEVLSKQDLQKLENIQHQIQERYSWSKSSEVLEKIIRND